MHCLLFTKMIRVLISYHFYQYFNLSTYSYLFHCLFRFWRLLQLTLPIRPSALGLPFRTNFNDTVSSAKFKQGKVSYFNTLLFLHVTHAYMIHFTVLVLALKIFFHHSSGI